MAHFITLLFAFMPKKMLDNGYLESLPALLAEGSSVSAAFVSAKGFSEHSWQGRRVQEEALQGPTADIWEFPKVRGTMLGAPIIRNNMIIFGGSLWGPPTLGKYPFLVARMA